MFTMYFKMLIIKLKSIFFTQKKNSKNGCRHINLRDILRKTKTKLKYL